MDLREFLRVTDNLNDDQFDLFVRQTCQVRRARNEGTAYARAMDVATAGIWGRHTARVPALAGNRNLDAAAFEVRAREQACLSADAFERRVRELNGQSTDRIYR